MDFTPHQEAASLAACPQGYGSFFTAATALVGFPNEEGALVVIRFTQECIRLHKSAHQFFANSLGVDPCHVGFGAATRRSELLKDGAVHYCLQTKTGAHGTLANP